MLGNMTSYSQVGYYENAGKIINIPMGVITALGTVMLPRMSSIVSSGEREKARDYIRISIKLVTIMGSAIAFGLIGISDILVPIYFGTEYLPCISLINLLSVTVFFISWANVVRTQYLIPLRYDKIYVLSMVLGAFVNFVINYTLIPQFQGNGAAVGTIAAEFTVMITQMILIRHSLPIFRYCSQTIPYLFIGFIMQVVVGFYGRLRGESVSTLIVQILLGALVYSIGCVVYFIVSKDEIGSLVFNEIKSIKRRRIQ